MEKEKLIIRLSTQIDTIKAHINRLKKPGYNIHALDVDMLRQKTYEFYEHVTELESLIAGKPVGDYKPEPVIEKKEIEIVKEEIVPEEATVPEELKEPEKEEVVEIAKVSIKEPEPVKTEENKIAEESTPIPKPEPIIELETKEEVKSEQIIEEITPEPIPELIVEQTPTKQTAYDLFSENTENVVAEKFYANEEQSIADKMQKTHISNIREAIGINEKFLFINELFNGDLGRYNKIMDDINELPTKKGVDTYLLELKIQFQWADENDAFNKLKELLERKFS